MSAACIILRTNRQLSWVFTIVVGARYILFAEDVQISHRTVRVLISPIGCV